MTKLTRQRLRSVALIFFVLGLGAIIVRYQLPRAADHQLSKLQETAAPSVEALAEREAADTARNANEAVAPQESQPVASSEPVETQRVIEGATITNYQALAAQTDGDPCTTADGMDVYPFPAEGVVANNCLDFGTQVYIADEVYVVHDRMARRYTCDYFDILTTKPIATFVADVVVL